MKKCLGSPLKSCYRWPGAATAGNTEYLASAVHVDQQPGRQVPVPRDRRPSLTALANKQRPAAVDSNLAADQRR